MSDALPNLLTPRQVALWLDITRKQLEELSKRGEIPSVPLPDGTFMYLPADLSAWVESRRQSKAAKQGEAVTNV